MMLERHFPARGQGNAVPLGEIADERGDPATKVRP